MFYVTKGNHFMHTTMIYRILYFLTISIVGSPLSLLGLLLLRMQPYRQINHFSSHYFALLKMQWIALSAFFVGYFWLEITVIVVDLFFLPILGNNHIVAFFSVGLVSLAIFLFMCGAFVSLFNRVKQGLSLLTLGKPYP